MTQSTFDSLSQEIRTLADKVDENWEKTDDIISEFATTVQQVQDGQSKATKGLEAVKVSIDKLESDRLPQLERLIERLKFEQANEKSTAESQDTNNGVTNADALKREI